MEELIRIMREELYNLPGGIEDQYKKFLYNETRSELAKEVAIIRIATG